MTSLQIRTLNYYTEAKLNKSLKKENINRSNTRSDLSECSYIRNKALFD